MINSSVPISEPEPMSRSPSADRSACDLNHAADELSNEFQNVGLDEVASWNVSERDGNQEEESEVLYPVRPGAEDCAFYMRTGSCKFGSTCKFNHPLPNPRKIHLARDNNKVREKDGDADQLRLVDCKYYLRTGGCKYGETCRFNHTKPQELNILGLPIRPGEIECPYYMRTGSCKFGADCKFNHPDPTTIGGTDSPSFHGSPKNTFQTSSTSWSSPNGTAPFIPSMLSQSPSERSGFSPSTTYIMNNTSSETSIFSQFQYQMPAEEFPERPDQPECTYYLKTGDCKFKFSCKYHHPKNRLPKEPPYALNDKGLPLRPDQNMCTHYSRYGICKFGPACRFDHSIQLPCSTGNSHVVVEPPQVGTNGNESDGWN